MHRCYIIDETTYGICAGHDNVASTGMRTGWTAGSNSSHGVIFSAVLMCKTIGHRSALCDRPGGIAAGWSRDSRGAAAGESQRCARPGLRPAKTSRAFVDHGPGEHPPAPRETGAGPPGSGRHHLRRGRRGLRVAVPGGQKAADRTRTVPIPYFLCRAVLQLASGKAPGETVFGITYQSVGYLRRSVRRKAGARMEVRPSQASRAISAAHQHHSEQSRRGVPKLHRG